MSRTLSIFVPIMPPSTNSIYAGCHWAKRKKHADAAHAAVIDAMPDHCFSAGAQFQRAVSITVTPSLGKGCRGRDVSNYSYAAKLIEDGLVQSGVLRGDEADKVASMTLYAPVVDRGSPSGLHVTITEVPA